MEPRPKNIGRIRTIGPLGYLDFS